MKTFYDKLPDLSTRTVLAKILEIHPQTLARAERAGKLESTRLNSRQIIYEKAAVLNYLLGNKE
jgi:hypothetical protein